MFDFILFYFYFFFFSHSFFISFLTFSFLPKDAGGMRKKKKGYLSFSTFTLSRSFSNLSSFLLCSGSKIKTRDFWHVSKKIHRN